LYGFVYKALKYYKSSKQFQNKKTLFSFRSPENIKCNEVEISKKIIYIYKKNIFMTKTVSK